MKHTAITAKKLAADRTRKAKADVINAAITWEQNPSEVEEKTLAKKVRAYLKARMQ